MIKIKEHDKIHLKADISRCPQRSADFEKIVMTQVMRILNRNHKKATISSETKITGSNSVTDVQMIVYKPKHHIYNFELQKEHSEAYNEKMTRRDDLTDTETIVIRLKPLLKKYGKTLEKLRKELEAQLF